MKKISVILLAVMGAVLPNTLRADIVEPPYIVPTFENRQSLTATFRIDGATTTDTATLNISPGIEHTLDYRYTYPEAFFGEGSDLTEDEKNEKFIEEMRIYRGYLELWSGEPYTPDASLVKAWEITGTQKGTVNFSVPQYGKYFLVVQFPNALYTDEYFSTLCGDTPVNECSPDGTLLAGTIERERDHFKTIPGRTLEWGTVSDFVLFMGGMRFTVPPPKTQTSNILFIPGVTGSRMYTKNGGKEKRLWEPNLLSSQKDIQMLYLNTKGKSVNAVYVKPNEVIAHVDIPLVGSDVYKTFFEKLNTLKAAHKINDFLLFPYDWRLSPLDIAESAIQYESNSQYLLSAVTSLASSSATGKVTIIAHSNGGLVAKAFLQSLERKGKVGLIDKVLLVDSPQIGTPDTLSTMLHGDFGSLTSAGGLFLSKANARGFVENMPDAFTLLPSPAYFAAGSSVINLSDAPKLKAKSGIKENIISTYKNFTQLITGSNGRVKPAANDGETPNVLSSSLLASSTALHSTLDGWQPPDGITLIQIAGWGRDTPKSVSYTEQDYTLCTLVVFCTNKTVLQHKIEMSTNGDGTVMESSQILTNKGLVYYINLSTANKVLKKNWSHSDILESVPFQDLFLSLLASTTPEVVPAFVSSQPPNISIGSARVHVNGSASGTLEARDSEGRHTGIVSDQQGAVLAKEENIPNSYYRELGEEKYLGIPLDSGSVIALSGISTGLVSFDVVANDGGRSASHIFKDIPVSESTKVQVSIGSDPLVPVRASIDEDGDGVTDVELEGASSTSEVLPYIKLFKLIIPKLSLRNTSRKHLLDSLVRIEKDIGAGKPKVDIVKQVSDCLLWAKNGMILVETLPVGKGSSADSYHLNMDTAVIINFLEGLQGRVSKL